MCRTEDSRKAWDLDKAIDALAEDFYEDMPESDLNTLRGDLRDLLDEQVELCGTPLSNWNDGVMRAFADRLTEREMRLIIRLENGLDFIESYPRNKKGVERYIEGFNSLIHRLRYLPLNLFPLSVDMLKR